MFATSRSLRSLILRCTFSDGPCRFNLRLFVSACRRPSASPQRTRCSVLGISALPKFSANFLERDWGKPTHVVGRQAITLIDVFAVPTTRKFFDYPRCLSAMSVERLVKTTAHQKRRLTTDDLARLLAQLRRHVIEIEDEPRQRSRVVIDLDPDDR